MINFIKSILEDRRKLSIAAIIVVSAAIVLTVFVAQKQQEIRQRAEGEKTAFFFSTGTGCTNPVGTTSLPLPPNTTYTLNLCFNTNNDNTAASLVSGFDVTIAKGSGITFTSISDEVDGARLKTAAFNSVMADETIRFSKVDQDGITVSGNTLYLGKITLTTGSSGNGDINMTKAQVIDQTGLSALTVAKPILPYTITQQSIETPTPTPPPGATITPTPGPATITILGHFVDPNGADLGSNIGQGVYITVGMSGGPFPVTYNSTPAWRQVFWNDSLSPANGYIVTATAIAGYSISYSLCNGCTDHTVAGGHPYISGNSVTVNLPTGGNYADIYFKYVFTSTITLTPTPPPGATITPTPGPSCPLKNRGDADCNGKINIFDFNIWRDEFLEVANTTSSNFDGSGGEHPITIFDFNIWRDGFLDPSLPH